MCTFLEIPNTFQFNSEWKWYFMVTVKFKKRNSISLSSLIERRAWNSAAKKSKCLHCTAQVTQNNRIEPRTDLFSKLIELDWLSKVLLLCAMMCNVGKFAVIHSNRSESMTQSTESTVSFFFRSKYTCKRSIQYLEKLVSRFLFIFRNECMIALQSDKDNAIEREWVLIFKSAFESEQNCMRINSKSMHFCVTDYIRLTSFNFSSVRSSIENCARSHRHRHRHDTLCNR